ncbi:NUDIX domain-containing protein [Halolamina sp. CBA1230]|uniref:NUDIX domain-containing protein n=1 Tax=Halolamina sp. CBA1230 TaxID=1853690 RepID=UPI0009A1CF19|nr:NUDIX domain-containing protein [Halolamina sp. CBA1230]QKY21046.1 NUDIX domain-containing protein [Halolamina sp. CBA1230]
MRDDHEPFVGKITQKAILFGPDGDVLLAGSVDRPEPPGGTFEFGETLVGGLRRELREELGVDARIGPPVGANYGLWADEDGTPMVTILYRCETDEREVTLNDEHERAEWVTPETAAERLGELSSRLEDAVERAAALNGEEPFEVVADPYADSETTTEELLAALEAAREE